MDQANPGQTSLEDYDIDGFDPHLSDQTSGIGSDLEISLGTDPLDLCSTEILDERTHLDSRVFNRHDSNSVTLTSSVLSDHSYFTKKKSVTEDLPDGWKRTSVQRVSGAGAGRWDRYLICPNGKRFRSNVQLDKYLNANSIEVDKNVINFRVEDPNLQNPSRRKNKANDLLLNYTFPKTPFYSSGIFPFRFSPEDQLTATRACESKREENIAQTAIETPVNNFWIRIEPPKKAKLPKIIETTKAKGKRNLGKKPKEKQPKKGSKSTKKTVCNSRLTSKNSFNIFNNFSSFITDNNEQPSIDLPNLTGLSSETPLHQKNKRSAKTSKQSFKKLSTKKANTKIVEFPIQTDDNFNVSPILTCKKGQKAKPKRVVKDKSQKKTNKGLKQSSSTKPREYRRPKLVADPCPIVDFNYFGDTIIFNDDDPMFGGSDFFSKPDTNFSNSLDICETNHTSPVVSNRIIISTETVSSPSGVCSFCGIGQPANYPATELLDFCLFCCEPHHQSCIASVSEVLPSPCLDFPGTSLCGSLLTSL